MANPTKQTFSNPTLAPLTGQAGQKLVNNLGGTANGIQSETFLVMSLKKQLKESKAEVQKKDEELEQLKKNVRSTRY